MRMYGSSQVKGHGYPALPAMHAIKETLFAVQTAIWSKPLYYY